MMSYHHYSFQLLFFQLTKHPVIDIFLFIVVIIIYWAYYLMMMNTTIIISESSLHWLQLLLLSFYYLMRTYIIMMSHNIILISQLYFQLFYFRPSTIINYCNDKIIITLITKLFVHWYKFFFREFVHHSYIRFDPQFKNYSRLLLNKINRNSATTTSVRLSHICVWKHTT